MLRCLLLAAAATTLMTAQALAEDCYHKADDKTDTLEELEGSQMVWKKGGKTNILSLSKADASKADMIAEDDAGHSFKIEFVGEKMLFDGKAYEKGCGN